MIARARIRQAFRNPDKEWAEGVYVFPLPAEAAVDHMRMRVGDRVIEGEIQERARARETYVRAKREGKRASLVEQERPNVFTASVANIGPGATIEVEIEYQHVVRYDDGEFRLRFPMVVGPRYVPGMVVAWEEQRPSESGTGWAFDTDQVPDASRITPPVQHPAAGPINPLPLSLTIDLAAGFPLSRLESIHHEVTVTSDGAERRLIRLKDGHVPADRDFELVWAPVTGGAPRAAAFLEQKQDRTYGLFMILPPPAAALDRGALKREVIYVIDTSGSMHGTSIEQAKAALAFALERLTPNDRFNVIQFNSAAHVLFDAPKPATHANSLAAVGYVRSLRAEGGTEMLSAMTLALSGAEPSTRLRQIVFLTDGLIGNEAALFRAIRQRLGQTRLFTIGIGSAPNSHFMQRAARFGRGTYTYIGKLDEVRDKVDRLLRKLDHAALTDIEIDPSGWVGPDVQPLRIPDLYLGEPVLVAVEAERFPSRITLRGRFGERPWEAELPVDQAESREGVAVYWARQKIASLMDQQPEPQGRDDLRASVVDIALTHHLVSRFTSLVAVDVTPVRPRDARLDEHAVKTNLPHGQDYAAIFGLPRTATSAGLRIVLGLCLLLAASSLLLARRRPC